MTSSILLFLLSWLALGMLVLIPLSRIFREQAEQELSPPARPRLEKPKPAARTRRLTYV